MVLNNIKHNRSESGFTIVELLIVIVVIAILATISIVAYSGIQTRAKTTKAQANAAQVQKIAEAYYADNSVYPTTLTHFNSNATAKLPASVTLVTAAAVGTIPAVPAAMSNATGENSIMYRYIGTAPNATGACVFYWDFVTGGGQMSTTTQSLYLGNATTATCTSATGASGNSLITGS